MASSKETAAFNSANTRFIRAASPPNNSRVKRNESFRLTAWRKSVAGFIRSPNMADGEGCSSDTCTRAEEGSVIFTSCLVGGIGSLSSTISCLTTASGVWDLVPVCSNLFNSANLFCSSSKRCSIRPILPFRTSISVLISSNSFCISFVAYLLMVQM